MMGVWVYDPPNWDINTPQIIRNRSVISDSVYYFKRQKNNHDSILAMVEYFDSLGNKIERDEFGFENEIWRITNYTYLEGLLTKKEEVSKAVSYFNSHNTSTHITTYDHDAFGNITVEKQYAFEGNSSKPLVSILNKMYDSSGRLVKQVEIHANANLNLHYSYSYNNENLTEVMVYDAKKKWMYAYLHEFNEQMRMESIYFNNHFVKNLDQELFYDEEKRLIQEKTYGAGALTDHSTITYSYETDGLLKSQTFQTNGGENYYYKHFYTKKI